MILKKPYAFLIKRFRLIHFLSFGAILFVLISTNPIVSTLGELVNTGKITIFNNTSIIVYLAILINVIFSFAMYLLMKNKKKPSNFYIFGMIYYFIFLIFVFIGNNIINNVIETSVVNIQTSRMYYDLARIAYYPQIFFLIFSLVRSIGFDIKRFNFSKDLAELDVSTTDNEEFEFVLGFDYREYIVKLRRYGREWRYYFLENTAIIVTIFIVGTLVAIFFIFFKKELTDKEYGQNQIFNVGFLQYSVTDSYVTNLSKTGSEISKGKYYLVVNANLKNTSASSEKIIFEEITVATKTKTIVAEKTVNSYFTDLGIQYSGEDLLPNTNVNRLFVFTIDDFKQDDVYKLQILSGNKYNEKTRQTYGKYQKVLLNPTFFADIKDVDTKFYGSEVILNESTLKNTTLTVNDYVIEDNYTFEYEQCNFENDCETFVDIIIPKSRLGNSTLLVLDYELDIDTSSYYARGLTNKANFFQDFLKVKYISNGDEYDSKVILINSKKLKDKVVLEVDSSIKYSDKINLEIIVRNIRYIINLK